MKAPWPGPVTLILTKNNLVHDFAVSGLDTIAIRIPSSKFVLNLISRLNKPMRA